MSILSGDIKLLASKVMDDVPNGGGGPTGTVIPDGASNAIFGDVTERARAGGSVSIRQLHLAVQTPTTAAYMDPSIIVSKLPNDANVSITLAKCDMFAQRTEIANAIENYLIQGPEWGGYLLENHVAGQRSIQIFQRPGTPPPPIGRTLVLIASEGLPSEVRQFVRVTRVEVEQRTFTYSSGGSFVDYKADVVVCDLTDALRSSFAGSPPDRGFTRVASKTIVRDTTVADAATFYGASPLTAAASLGDSILRVSSVYTQLVPSARTEVVALDQKPAAQRTLVLAESPRRVEVGTTPHTMRIRVGQENRGFAWTQMLKPRPAPGTLVISYMALGNWNTVTDDGTGVLTGAGAGTVNYATGSLAVTFPSLPDTDTSIIFSWGENTAFTSRAGQAGFRAPEFAWALPQSPVKPGSVTVKWMSGGVLKTATDNSAGGFAGDATGEINYAAGKVFLRPAAMIDAGGEFSTSFEYSTARTQNVASVAVDAGGFAALTLDESPAPKSITVKWVTVRNVSSSSGTSELVSSSGAQVPDTVVVSAPEHSGCYLSVSTSYALPGTAVACRLSIAAPQTPGTYTWEVVPAEMVDASVVVQGGSASGTFEVLAPVGQQLGSGGPMGAQQAGQGSFSFTIAGTCPDLRFSVRVKNQALTVVAGSGSVEVDALGDQPAPAWPPAPPPAAIQLREPIATGVQQGASAPVTAGMYPGGVDLAGRRVYVGVVPSNDAAFGPHYDHPASTAEVWTAAQILSGKPLTSQRGLTTTYQVWNEAFTRAFG